MTNQIGTILFFCLNKFNFYHLRLPIELSSRVLRGREPQLRNVYFKVKCREAGRQSNVSARCRLGSRFFFLAERQIRRPAFAQEREETGGNWLCHRGGSRYFPLGEDPASTAKRSGRIPRKKITTAGKNRIWHGRVHSGGVTVEWTSTYAIPKRAGWEWCENQPGSRKRAV